MAIGGLSSVLSAVGSLLGAVRVGGGGLVSGLAVRGSRVGVAA